MKGRYGAVALLLALLCLLSSCDFRLKLKELPQTPPSKTFVSVAADSLSEGEASDKVFWASTCDFAGSKLSPSFAVEQRGDFSYSYASPVFPSEEYNLLWQSMVEEALELYPSYAYTKVDFTLTQVRSLYRLDAFFFFSGEQDQRSINAFYCYWDPQLEVFADFLSFFSEFSEYQPYLADYLRAQCEDAFKDVADPQRMEAFLQGDLSFASFEVGEEALKVVLDETNLLRDGAHATLEIPYYFCDGGIIEKLANQWKEYNPAKPGEKVIALTFDDGPKNANTNEILDVLERYKVKATFFVAGHRISNSTGKTLRRVLELGSQIGNHSYSHPNFHLMTMEEVMDEINRTQEAVYAQTGVYPTCLRPPYGNLHIDRCGETGMYVILWNEDTLDWEHRDSQILVNNVKQEASSGDIILMHDSQSTVTNGASVEEIVVWLLEQGYRLVTVEELFDLRSQEPAGHKYFSQQSIR